MIDTGMNALGAVDGLYRAALREGSWEETTRQMCEFLRSSCACIAWRDDSSGRIHHFTSLDSEHRDRGGMTLECDVAPARMFDPRVTARSLPLDVGEKGAATDSGNGDGDGESDDRESAALRVYAWHREQGRCPYCVGAGVRIDEHTSAYIGAHWRRVEDVVGGDAGERLAALVGPFVHALRLRARLAELVGDLDAADAALDHLPLGVVFLGAEGTITRLNCRAHDLLAAGDGLETREGRLVIEDPESATAFADAIGRCAANAHPQDGFGATSLTVRRHSGRRAYELMVMPALASGGDTVAVMYVADPEESAEVDPDALERLFDLSAPEARVVALLARGSSPREVAGELGVAIGAVRDHVAEVFRKTGVNRQGELLRLVLESSSASGGGDG